MIQKTQWTLLLFLFLFIGNGISEKKSEVYGDETKPNVILIMTDDQGYADLGCYDAKDFTTPNIDKLATEGRRFTNFYAGSTICSPSRAALMTGCYPQRVGIDHFVFFPTKGENPGPGKTGLNPNEFTMAEMFKQVGYRTACVGKWHLGDAKPFLPLQQGFDEYFGLPYSNDMKNGESAPKSDIRTGFPPLPLYEGENVIETEPDQRFLTHKYTQRAIDFIKKNKSRPFFLYLPHSMPHVPLHPHPDFAGKSKNGIYGDVIQEIDWSVGEIVRTVKENGLDEKTIIIFTSDNGPWLSMLKHGGNAKPLRDGKQTKYDGGHRVPCIIRYPKVIQPGTVGDEIISSIDFLPSFASLVGSPLPKNRVIDGINVWPYLSGKSSVSPRTTYFYNTKVVRKGPWKLFLPGKYPEFNEESGQYKSVKYSHERLYRLTEDISEQKDVHESYPDVVKELKSLLEKYDKDIKTNGRPLGHLDDIQTTAAVKPDTTGLPNILWLTLEDINPDFGCYNHPDAVTPAIDRLASQGMKYSTCWSTFPVCAPARTSLLMGISAGTMGGHHMRSLSSIPRSLKPYPQLLRERGYYTTNNAKTDYNVDVDLKKLWDQCGKKAHWKDCPKNQPFFSVFNIEITHESQIRNENTLEVARRHDPAKLKEYPPYYPDDLVIRKDLAQYHDRITQADDIVKRHLDELEKAGLAENTIVFVFGDNGGGMPRGKRVVLDSGLRVPVIVRIPGKFKHLAPPEYQKGGTSERLISFIDFAPTLLSLAGEKAPQTMEGKAFMGKFDAGPQQYIYGYRDRMDERYDCSRAIRSGEFLLVLNFYPSIIPGAENDYMYQTPTTSLWRQYYREGKLNPIQSLFFETKPFVELYKVADDPYQVHNLAGLPEYSKIEKNMFDALNKRLIANGDLGIMPESVFQERSENSTPYEMGRHSMKIIENIFNIASEVNTKTNRLNVMRNDPKILAGMLKLAESQNELPSYWGTVGLLNLLVSSSGKDGTTPVTETEQLYSKIRNELVKRLNSRFPIVRIPAAEAMGRFGTMDDVKQASAALAAIVESDGDSPYRLMEVLHAADSFAERMPDQYVSVFTGVKAPFGTSPRIVPVFNKINDSITKKRSRSKYYSKTL